MVLGQTGPVLLCGMETRRDYSDAAFKLHICGLDAINFQVLNISKYLLQN